jgi:hypothetical protein
MRFSECQFCFAVYRVRPLVAFRGGARPNTPLGSLVRALGKIWRRRGIGVLQLGSRVAKEICKLLECRVRHRYPHNFHIAHRALAEFSRRSRERNQDDSRTFANLGSGDKDWGIGDINGHVDTSLNDRLR